MAAKCWLFQANPDRFDIDGFLATRPFEFSWLVTSHKEEIAPGDRVFVWRSLGSQSGSISGIIAETVVGEAPQPRVDDEQSVPFWRDRTEGGAVRDRALLRVVRVATARQVVRRDWLREDPLLSELRVLQIPRETNYELSPEEAARLNALWSRTGRDWTYAECVAGLWAYHKTYGGEVSRLLGSPVAHVALLVGRAVSGVYNKVMNFRAIDPRETRKGMTGSSDTDSRVWTEFFDPESNALRQDALEEEFQRLWGDARPVDGGDNSATQDQVIDDEVRRLSSLRLDELLAMFSRRGSSRQIKPRVKLSISRQYERDALVVAIAKKRADFRCEVPGCSHSQFVDQQGQTYCEVHHIRPLADGGEDTLDNVVCICPSHHREVHHGHDAVGLNTRLMEIRSQESALGSVRG